MHLVSKFFRVAQEGATTDGRAISRKEIEQMANNYNPKKYGARVWLEHFRSILPDGLFPALGDVLALTTKEDDGKLGLYAQISPTPELVAMNQKRQKIYSSIEIKPEFSDTGEAYLVGLAVTDSPASLGTEAMAFSANAKVSLFADRKLDPENLFSEATESIIEFEEQAEEKPSLFAKIKAILDKNKTETDHDYSDISQSIEAVAESQQELIEQVEGFSQAQSETAEQFNELKQAHETLLTKFNELETKLSQTPGHDYRERPAASGGDGKIQTDC
ncbi:MAG: GPO family capsid scaffolding protein [Candidatus Pacearchaeota archaeon]|nr:GPO family capsid scaffolding protein [Candidatus Pacearchaeota archaeon]